MCNYCEQNKRFAQTVKEEERVRSIRDGVVGSFAVAVPWEAVPRDLLREVQGKLADIAQRHLGSGLTLEKALLEAWCLGFNCNDE